MKLLFDHGIRRVLGFVVLSAFMGGCSFVATTTNGVSSTVNAISDVTSSTTDAFKGDKSAFVESRFAAVRYDAARGYGENLDTLAALLGEPDRAEFARWMKAHYGELFVDLDAPSELLVRIETRRSRES